MVNVLSFDINNGSEMRLVQDHHDEAVHIKTVDASGCLETETTIPAGAMVTLLNMYKYIVENDIRNEFINPYGKNREE